MQSLYSNTYENDIFQDFGHQNPKFYKIFFIRNNSLAGVFKAKKALMMLFWIV